MLAGLESVIVAGRQENKRKISPIDLDHYQWIRKSVSDFLIRVAQKFDHGGLLLDVAPQVHEGAAYYFKKSIVKTLDIDPNAETDITADICQDNSHIVSDNTYDFVVCTEVLEHVLNPFYAVREIHRIMRLGGLAFFTTPFNFRIHGPLPDCWRFTEHGLKELLKQFQIVELRQVETQDRWLMPIHYTVIAKKV